MNINTAALSTEAKQALCKFGVAAARYHAAKKKKIKVRFRYSESIQEVYCPRSIETDYIDAKIALKSLDELKEVSDSIDSGLRLDALEGTRFAEGADQRYKASYDEMVEVEKEISKLASTL